MDTTTISTELKSHFLRLYKIACADESFDVIELKQLYKFAEERGVSEEQLHSILTNPIERTGIPIALEDRITYLYDLAIMIWIDKQITEDEYNLLKKYCKTFEFVEENIIEICDFLLECAKKEMPKEEVLKTIKN